MVPPPSPCTHEVTFRAVAALTGAELCVVTLPCDYDVCDLKADIADTCGIRDCEQQLICKGRVLRNLEELGTLANKDGTATEISLIRMDPERAETLRAVGNGQVRLADINPSYRADWDVVHAAVVRDGRCLKVADETLRDDKDIVLAAAKSHGQSLEYASLRLRSDVDVVRAALQRDGLSIKHAMPELQCCEELAETAVRQNGYALELTPVMCRNNKVVVMAAIENEGEAIRYASSQLRADREVVMTAVRSNNEALKWIDPALRDDPAVQHAASFGVRILLQ